MNDYITSLSQTIAKQLLAKKLRLVTAESCTGGGVAYYLTELAGSSQWFEGGFITYSNAAKQAMLGVSAEIIEKQGAVSIETAHAMAEGALQQSQADISLAITGIAGPSGGSAEKPVGTVCFGWAGKNFSTHTEQAFFKGDRAGIRQQAIVFALETLLKLI